MVSFTHAPCLLKLLTPPSNGTVRCWFFPEFGAELPLDNCNWLTFMKCKHTKRLLTAVRRHLSELRSKRRMRNYCTPHIIKENLENFLIHRCNYILLSQVYCVWQVVKTPTVISNNPVLFQQMCVIILKKGIPCISKKYLWYMTQGKLLVWLFPLFKNNNK